jgi:hypothetical protein
MNATALRTVTSEEFRHMNGELHDAALDDELTIEQLHDAMRAVHSDDHRSVGMSYIQYHISAFTSLVPANQRVQFFAEHLDNPDIVRVILLTNIFDSFESEGREQLVCDITSRYPMPDCTWIRTVGASGRISDEVVTECIKMQLNTNRFSVEQSRPFAESFLLHGSGSRMVLSQRHLDYEGDPYYEFYDQFPAWTRVSEKDFAEIIELCVRRAPEVMFMPGAYDHPELHLRLRAIRPGSGHQRGPYHTTAPEFMMTRCDVSRLRNIAANILCTLEGLSVEQLMELSLGYQKAILEQALPGSLEFLVRATLHDDFYDETEAQQRQRRSFFRDHYPKLTVSAEEAIAAYRKLYFVIAQSLQDNDAYRTAMKIDRELKQLLTRHGYYLGKVTSERSDRHGWQTLIRTDVNGRKVKIIQNGKQHERFNRDDLVYVDRNTDLQLAKWLNEGRTLLFANFHHVNPNRGDNKI